jgi:ribosomal protein S18 acetylase RimI-like enzyme
MQITRDDSEDAAKAIQDGLRAFNRAAGHPGSAPLNVVLRDGEGRVRGGIVAQLGFDSVYLDTVWIDEAMRGQGHGRAMVVLIEDEARKRGALQSWLYTLSWQAPGFYEKLGYRVFGEIPYHRADHKRFFLVKAL